MRELRDYCYQLLEYLRYALQNLDPTNFNEQEMDAWITKPIMAQITDVNGNIAQLVLTADSLTSQLESAEGSISTLQQTANALTTRVQSAEGSITTVQQTANGLSTTVSDLSGKYTSLKQTVDGFDIKGNINSILSNGVAQMNFLFEEEKVGTITQNGSGSMIMQSAGELLLTANNGPIQLNGTGDAQINSNSDIELNADSDIYIDASYGRLFLYGGNTTVKLNDNGMSVDNDLWVDGTKIASSDREVKNTITYDLDGFTDLFRTLKPCRFKYNNGKSNRFHTGFIAQEVEQEIADSGFADTDLAVVVQENHGTEEAGKYGLRYSELIALNTAMIQKLMTENENLKAEIAALKEKIDAT